MSNGLIAESSVKGQRQTLSTIAWSMLQRTRDVNPFGVGRVFMHTSRVIHGGRDACGFEHPSEPCTLRVSEDIDRRVFGSGQRALTQDTVVGRGNHPMPVHSIRNGGHPGVNHCGGERAQPRVGSASHLDQPCTVRAVLSKAPQALCQGGVICEHHAPLPWPTEKLGGVEAQRRTPSNGYAAWHHGLAGVIEYGYPTRPIRCAPTEEVNRDHQCSPVCHCSARGLRIEPGPLSKDVHDHGSRANPEDGTQGRDKADGREDDLVPRTDPHRRHGKLERSRT